MTKCSFCGLEYAPEDAKSACNNCPLGTICTHQCCPNCGYLESEAPTWLIRLKNWLNWRDADDAQLDHHFASGTIALPVARPPNDVTRYHIFRAVWNRLVKATGKRK